MKTIEVEMRAFPFCNQRVAFGRCEHSAHEHVGHPSGARPCAHHGCGCPDLNPEIRLRPVDVPDEELPAEWSTLARLESVFRWGQNDFQPKPFCSVSVGDVIRFDVGRWEVKGIGFEQLDTLSVCPNCQQWQHPPTYDCLNQCRARGFAQGAL